MMQPSYLSYCLNALRAISQGGQIIQLDIKICKQIFLNFFAVIEFQKFCHSCEKNFVGTLLSNYYHEMKLYV